MAGPGTLPVEADGALTSTIYRAMSPILQNALKEREGIYPVFDDIVAKIPIDGLQQWFPFYDRVAPYALFPENTELPKGEMHAYIQDITTDRFGRGIEHTEYDSARLDKRMPVEAIQKSLQGLTSRYATFYNSFIKDGIIGSTARYGTTAIKTTNIYGYSLFSASNPFVTGGNVLAGVSWTPEGIYETFADRIKPKFFDMVDNFGEPFWDAIKMAQDETFLCIYPAERDAAFKRAFKIDSGPSVQTFPGVAYAAEPREGFIKLLGKPVLFPDPRLNGTSKWYCVRIDKEAPLLIMGMTELNKGDGRLFGAPNANFNGVDVENRSFIEMRVTQPGDTHYQNTGDYLVSVRLFAGLTPGVSQSGVEITVP